jgi:cobalt/nickel transport system permease protein
VIGVGVTVVAGTGIFWAVRKRRTGEDATATSVPENA